MKDELACDNKDELNEIVNNGNTQTKDWEWKWYDEHWMNMWECEWIQIVNA